jgi:hypothetical protein
MYICMYVLYVCMYEFECTYTLNEILASLKVVRMYVCMYMSVYRSIYMNVHKCIFIIIRMYDECIYAWMYVCISEKDSLVHELCRTNLPQLFCHKWHHRMREAKELYVCIYVCMYACVTKGEKCRESAIHYIITH